MALPLLALAGPAAYGVSKLFGGGNKNSNQPAGMPSLDQLSFGDNDIQLMIDDFLKSFRSDAAVQKNEITENAARNDLPSDVTQAALRGADINNNRAMQSGFNKLKIAGKQSQFDAQKFLAQLQFQIDSGDKNRSAQREQALYGAIGSAASVIPFFL